MCVGDESSPIAMWTGTAPTCEGTGVSMSCRYVSFSGSYRSNNLTLNKSKACWLYILTNNSKIIIIIISFVLQRLCAFCSLILWMESSPSQLAPNLLSLILALLNTVVAMVTDSWEGMFWEAVCSLVMVEECGMEQLLCVMVSALDIPNCTMVVTNGLVRLLDWIFMYLSFVHKNIYVLPIARTEKSWTKH